MLGLRKKKTKYPQISHQAFEMFNVWDELRKNLNKKLKANTNVLGDYEKFQSHCQTYLMYLKQNESKLKEDKVKVEEMIMQLEADLNFIMPQIHLLKSCDNMSRKGIEEKK